MMDFTQNQIELALWQHQIQLSISRQNQFSNANATVYLAIGLVVRSTCGELSWFLDNPGAYVVNKCPGKTYSNPTTHVILREWSSSGTNPAVRVGVCTEVYELVPINRPIPVHAYVYKLMDPPARPFTMVDTRLTIKFSIVKLGEAQHDSCTFDI